MLDKRIDFGFSKAVAKMFGINAALIFNRVMWAINYHEENKERYQDRYFADGRWWMNDTFDALTRHFDGLFTDRTIKRAVKEMELAGLLIGRGDLNATSWDRTKWYAVEVNVYKHLLEHGTLPDVTMHSDKMSQSAVTNCPDGEGKNVTLSSNSPTHSRPENQRPENALTLVSDSSPPPKPKGKRKTATKPPPEPQDIALGEKWLTYLKTEMPWEVGSGYSAEKFATAIAKVRKAVGMEGDGMYRVFDFIYQSTFWRDVAISPAGLLKRNESGIRKIDTILLQMTKPDRKHARMAAMVNSAGDPF